MSIIANRKRHVFKSPFWIFLKMTIVIGLELDCSIQLVLKQKKIGHPKFCACLPCVLIKREFEDHRVLEGKYDWTRLEKYWGARLFRHVYALCTVILILNLIGSLCRLLRHGVAWSWNFFKRILLRTLKFL